MKNVLIIGGYKMLLADPDAYWTLVAILTSEGFNVRAKECDQDWFFAGARNKATAADILWADIVICYSYGMATYKNICHDLAKSWPDGKTHDMVIVVAGVPDAWMLQFYGNIWHLGEYVKKARFFNVDATPSSAGIKNDNYYNMRWEDQFSSNLRWVNIDCNGLVANLDPVSKHTHLMNLPEVIGRIRSMVILEK